MQEIMREKGEGIQDRESSGRYVHVRYSGK